MQPSGRSSLRFPGNKEGNYIARLVHCLQTCLQTFGVTTTTHADLLVRLEQMACLIHESMSVSSRNYHSVQHVFDVLEQLEGDENGTNDQDTKKHEEEEGAKDDCEQEDHIAILAILFHDCVYYHVDGGLSDLQYEKLRGAVIERTSTTAQKGCSCCCHNTDNHVVPARNGVKNGVIANTNTSCSPNTNHHHHHHNHHMLAAYKAHSTTPCCEDQLLCLVEKIFGYKEGQEVTHQNGLNEFLSAVICLRELQTFLPRSVLAQIACCIEATVPFRGPDKETGKTCMEKLFDNLYHANENFDLGLSRHEMVKAVQRAAKLANSDVANFGTSDVVWFLDNTWSLLPESNEELRRKYLYTVEQFQHAIFKMYGFFNNFLQANVIFPHYQGVPHPETLAKRVANAERNLQVGRKYLAAKLLSLSVLSAFAELTGGDAPVSMFMGDLPSHHRKSEAAATPNKKNTTPGLPGCAEHQDDPNENNSENLAFVGGDNPYPLDDEDDQKNDSPGGEAAPTTITTTVERRTSSAKNFFDSDAYHVLLHGRRSASFFDVKQSPMAAYLYRLLGDEQLVAVLNDVQVYPMTTTVARTLLRRLPRAAVQEVSKHLAEVAITRTDKIFAVMDSL